jgi:hypothetical protein
MQKYFFLLAFAAAVPQPGAAQSLNALRQGARIEVTPVHGKSQTGTVVLLGSDSLFYIPDRSADAGGLRSTSATSLGFADLRSVRESRGQSRLAGARWGGLIGTGIGVFGGAILGAATYSKPKPNGSGCLMFCSRGSVAAYGGAVGSGIGLWAGLIAGVITGRERWESVDLPRR